MRTLLTDELHLSSDIAEAVIGHKLVGVRGVYDRESHFKRESQALAQLSDLIAGYNGQVRRWRMNNCSAWPALAVIGLLLAAGQPSELEKAQADYAARQGRLRCAAHPEQGCLTQPESENAKARREYRERQERVRGCTFDAQDVCR